MRKNWVLTTGAKDRNLRGWKWCQLQKRISFSRHPSLYSWTYLNRSSVPTEEFHLSFPSKKTVFLTDYLDNSSITTPQLNQQHLIKLSTSAESIHNHFVFLHGHDFLKPLEHSLRSGPQHPRQARELLRSRRDLQPSAWAQMFEILHMQCQSQTISLLWTTSKRQTQKPQSRAIV